MTHVLSVSGLLTSYILGISFNYAFGEPETMEDDEMKEYNRTVLLGIDYYNPSFGGNLASRETSDYESQEQLNRMDKRKDIVVLDSMDNRNYKAEIKAGNKAEILGTNAHYYQPDAYPDFSRRFVLQYPYKEVASKNEDLIKNNKLTPKLAPPELVLAVAKDSAALDAAKPKNPTDDLIRKDILRSGDYWNAVWKEDVDPQILRTKKVKKLESVRAELQPGSKLYDLVSKLKHFSPTLLYVINKETT